MSSPPQGPPPPYGEQQPEPSYGQQYGQPYGQQYGQPYGQQYGEYGQPYGAMPPAPPYGHGEPQVAGLGGVRTASMGQRFVARLLDALIVGIPAAIIIGLVLGTAASNEADTLAAGGSPSAGFVATYFTTILIVAVLSALYEIGLIGTRGATLGKSIMGVKVVREADGQIPGWGPSAMRWLIPFLGSFVCGIGQLVVYLSPFFDNSGRQQGWHDKVAKTLVITTK